MEGGFEGSELLLSGMDDAPAFLKLFPEYLTVKMHFVDLLAHHLGLFHLDHQSAVLPRQLSLYSL